MLYISDAADWRLLGRVLGMGIVFKGLDVPNASVHVFRQA
jgi:hypothetical protein